MIAYLQLCSRNRKKDEAGSHALPSCLWTLSSQWLWLLPKIRNVLKDWEFDIGRGIQRIYFRIWKQFQEESENPFEQKQYHQRKYISLPRWHFEGEELTGQCKFKFHPFSSFFFSFPSFLIFWICYTTVFKVLDWVPHERIRPGIAKSIPFQVQYKQTFEALREYDNRDLWRPQGKDPACLEHPQSTVLKVVCWAMIWSLIRFAHCCCWLFATPWTAAFQSSQSLIISQSSPKFMYIELVMPSNHLIFCCPLLLLPSIFSSIRVFSNESDLHLRWPKYWSFSFSISPSKEYSGLISLRDWLVWSLCCPRDSHLPIVYHFTSDELRISL